MNKSEQGKVCLVTGATNGIGRSIASGLAELNYRVILAGRSLEKAYNVQQQIICQTQNEKIDIVSLNLESLSSILKCVAFLRSKYCQIDVLINNAGTFQTRLEYTEDLIEKQFCINYLGPFLFTNELINLLLCSPAARIINVSSNLHRIGSINFEDPFHEKSYDGIKAYAQSKLANVLFTNELARRYFDTNLTVNSVHPGAVNTNIGNNSATGIYGLIWRIVKPFMISPSKGAITPIYLADSEVIGNVTGKYFYKMRQVRSSKCTYSIQLAKALWEMSEKFIEQRKAIS